MVAPVELHVEESGAGTPPVVLLHGFGGSARNFRPQARFLAPRHRVLLYDARGHARSATPGSAEEYAMEALVADAMRMAARAGEGGAVLGGLSLGAAVALRAALENPGAFRGLVLAAFPPSGDPGPTSWARAFADAIDGEGLERAGERFVWGGERFDAAAAQLIRQGFLEHRPAALAATLRRTLAVIPPLEAERGRLRVLSLPVLVVVGDRDAPSLVPCRELARWIPGAQLRIIADAGHVVNLEKREQFNEVLGEFLSRIEG